MRAISNVSAIVLWCLPCLFAGYVGSLASVNSEHFYLGLARPDWAPPAWLFGVVWTILYVLMGVSAGLLWNGRAAYDVFRPLSVFLLQLAVNAFWTWTFFGVKDGGLAFAALVLLLALVGVTVVLFLKRRKLAGILLLPYLAWTIFAGFLTWTVWRMNPLAL